MARLLHAGLGAVEQQLDGLRRSLFAEGEAARTLAGLGIAAAGLRQVQAHLSYLGSRWPLGTADLFVRKLVAEGMPVPVPTLCPVNQVEDMAGEVGVALHERLLATGLRVGAPDQEGPVLAIPTIHLLDPLTWPALLLPLAAVVVDRQGLTSRLRGPSHLDPAQVRRRCVAGVAARLVGEATYAARAAQALVARLGGTGADPDLDLLAHAGERYALPMGSEGDHSLTAFFQRCLREQRALGSAWGRPVYGQEDRDGVGEWAALDDFLGAGLPAPTLPGAEDVEHLVTMLGDGRPINALPPRLPRDFAARLEAGAEAEGFYAVLGDAAERPCSLATILIGGWHYKLRESLTLCANLMGSDRPWSQALEPYAAHVHERSALLQQSIEAAYVQQVFTRGKDQ